MEPEPGSALRGAARAPPRHGAVSAIRRAWPDPPEPRSTGPGKLRGPTFDPITFALEKGSCPTLVDAKERLIPSVWAYQASPEKAERATARQREDEDALLIAMRNAPDRPISSWAEDPRLDSVVDQRAAQVACP
jgi:hypothetical protein